jgi:surfeit locus 1 family protein
VKALTRARWVYWTFIALMVGLTGLFVTLGVWQAQRLAEKEALIANVAARMSQPPAPIPPVAEWVGFDAEVYDYRPVTITGQFLHKQAVLVFTSLPSGSGAASGPGYWVMTPFALTAGGAVFVNRGFVPQQLASQYADDVTGPQGVQSLTGIGRRSEATGGFTPSPDIANRIEWVRDVTRLQAFADPALGPYLPITVDLPAGPPGALPQGGGTVVEFPNNHLGYAITWFGFALITPALLLFWALRQRRQQPVP